MRRAVAGVRVRDRGPVDDQLPVGQLDVVAGQRDDALDEVGLAVLGELEDGDLAALGHPEAVDQLVHEQVVADEQRGDHRPRGDLEGLDDERADDERQPDGDDDRLDVLAESDLLRAS